MRWIVWRKRAGRAGGFAVERNSQSTVAGLASFGRVMRGVVEASVVTLGFGLTILLIGTPLALVARGVREAVVALRLCE